MNKGAAFGPGHTNEQCVAEAFRLGIACRDDTFCELRAADFLRGCLNASQPSPGFCTGVPSRSLSDLFASQAWSSRFWEAHGRPHHGGIVADDPVREFCHPQ
jgi:hypothetical protein